MPTNSEFHLGMGLALLLALIMVAFVPENTNGGSFFLLILAALVVGVLGAMKMKDAQHKRNAFDPCQVSFENEFAKILCPSAPKCAGELFLFPPKEEGVVFQCPVCRQRIAVHCNSKGEIAAYGSKESEPIR